MGRIICFLAACCLAGSVLAADWHQFNGPDRDGISPEKGLANSWPADGPKELWKVNVGPGFGGAVIQDGKVFITDREDDKRDVIRALDLNTGKEIWRMMRDVPGRLPFNGSRCTPTLDGDHLFAISPFGFVYALNAKTGKVIWEHPFMKDFEGEPPRWGYSHSPLVVGNNVIIAPMSEKANLVSFHKKTGKLLWQSEGAGGDGYVSPNLVTLFGKQQVLMLNRDRLMSVDPQNGKLIWTYDGYKNPIPIPHPTVVPGNRLFLSGGYKAGSVMIQVEKKGDSFAAKELYKLDQRGSQIQQVIYYDGHLYANFNTNENMREKAPEGLLCMDLDGKTAWKTNDSPSVNRGNFFIADGKIYALGGENGELHMINATHKGFEPLASATVFDGIKPRENMIWAPMALSNGKLILRDQNVMKCLKLK